MAYLRTQSPVAIDREIRSLEVLPTDAQLDDDDKADRRGTPQEVEDLLLVLKFIDEQISKRENFEFIQVTCVCHGKQLVHRSRIIIVVIVITTILMPTANFGIVSFTMDDDQTTLYYSVL